ncbi:TPA: alpha/beta fold hydrolase [Streptococcus suis]|nr:alpha/beta fold hydrolase [Streptococcus suis]
MKKLNTTLVFILALAVLTACSVNEPSSQSSPSKASSQEVPMTNQDKSITASSNLVSEAYNVSYGDKTLSGIITAPENYKDGHFPTIVLSHGFNNTYEQFEDYAQHLASLGYVVYRFDFYGGSLQSKSGGQDMLDMSVATELEDLTQVVSHLSKEAYIDPENISLAGASQGGVVSSLYASRNPAKVKKLLLIFPAYVLFDDVRETAESYGDSLPDVIIHRNARLGSRYLTDALAIDWKEEAGKIKAKTLIVHGTDDNVVPYRYAQEAVELIPNAELVTVQGGGHWISDDFNQVAYPAIDAFLKED